MSRSAVRALLVVDVQNDFCAGGTLAVPDGDRVVEPINRLMNDYAAAGKPVFATRDWHPAGSRHFADHGGPWPVHCVADTPGAAFHPELRLPADTLVVSKGQTPDTDGYSAFEGTLSTGARLGDALDAGGVRELLVCGLATDYCVRASVLDAIRHGLRVEVVSDAIAAVDAAGGRNATAEMRGAGAILTTADAALART
ncbi:MAG: nicotinamidase [Acidobacteria bacterium]|nr:nicotinamidase [Acidobacteriota bacterium]